jgi:hypothetical protein
MSEGDYHSPDDPGEAGVPPTREITGYTAAPGGRGRRGRVRLGAVIAIALAAGVVAWLALRNNGNSGSSGTTKGGKTVALVSKRGLQNVAAAIRAPIYWAGPGSHVHYELTQTSDGRYYVRYLPTGVPAGSPQQYAFVATFPMSAAFTNTSHVAKRGGSVRLTVPNGIAFYSKASPTNVYLAYRGSTSQIEIFDPDPSRARQLVLQGRIQPVVENGATNATAATTVQLSKLKALPGKVSHPVYWAGPWSGRSYELTETSDGRIFIRYLPPGVKAGSPNQYLFVATFPLTNAFAATKAVAKRADSVTIPVGHGGIAFYSRKTPTNVYLAFPRSNYQIEVFDPNAALAHAEVRNNRIRSLS